MGGTKNRAVGWPADEQEKKTGGKGNKRGAKLLKAKKRGAKTPKKGAREK